MLYYERKLKRLGYNLIIGVDEVGRGCLAGPIIAVALIAKEERFPPKINDSKKLNRQIREDLFLKLLRKTDFAIGIVDSHTIDYINIHKANALAMEIAVNNLLERYKDKRVKACALVDGNIKLNLKIPYFNIIAADRRSKTVASASIIAKVLRDRLMGIYDLIYPQYNFLKHKGYPTRAHKKKIKDFGLSLIHRKSFHYV